MALEILLRRSIEGVGNVGEIVRVKNGYARNFLIPRGYASLVTPDALRRIVKDRKAEAIRQAEEAKARAELAEVLSELTVTIEARAGEDGHLYGSVTPRHALEALAREGFPLDQRQVRFEPIRELGEYEIPVALSREHVVNVKLWVVLDAREAAAAAAEAAERAAELEAAEAEGEGESTPETEPESTPEPGQAE
jgi:large subunit ribosomal protein L9